MQASIDVVTSCSQERACSRSIAKHDTDPITTRALSWVLLTALVSLSSATPPAHAAWTTVWDNGPSSNRVDIVFMGDGYTASQIDTAYTSHIDAMLNHMFNGGQDPFPRYRNFFNVHRIDVISNESGADVPPLGVFRDTALDASYYWDGVTDRLLYVNQAKANGVILNELVFGGASFSAEMRLVTVNDTRYGGGGGLYAVYAGGNGSAPEIALHELGHSFSSLADEYDYGGSGNVYMGGEPLAVNITKSPGGEKWAHWLGYNQPGIGVIGAYEGAGHYPEGLYRPSLNSKMRSLNRPFDAVSREKIILDIYKFVDPLDDWLANDSTISGHLPLWVDVVDPDVIQVEWYVDGLLVPGATDQSFLLSDWGFGSGAYEVTARAYDDTDWVRIQLDKLTQSVTWSVHAVPEPSTLVLAAAGPAVVLVLARRTRARRD